MRAATRKLLESLFSFHWFFAVGKKEDEKHALYVHSWADALEQVSNLEGSIFLMNQANIMTEQLPQRRRNLWNDLVSQIKPEVCELTKTQLWALPRTIAASDRIKIQDHTQWYILHACMEYEYNDLLQTRFYRNALDWYFSGHFPCGFIPNENGGTHIIF